MSVIRTERRARKAFRCEKHHPLVDNHVYSRGMVEVGETYVRIALTPHDREIGNEGWWIMRLCWSCADMDLTS